MSIAELRQLIDLIELRAKERGKSKADLAKLLNIDRATYYRTVKSGGFTFVQVSELLKAAGIGMYLGDIEVKKWA